MTAFTLCKKRKKKPSFLAYKTFENEASRLTNNVTILQFNTQIALYKLLIPSSLSFNRFSQVALNCMTLETISWAASSSGILISNQPSHISLKCHKDKSSKNLET